MLDTHFVSTSGTDVVDCSVRQCAHMHRACSIQLATLGHNEHHLMCLLVSGDEGAALHMIDMMCPLKVRKVSQLIECHARYTTVDA